LHFSPNFLRGAPTQARSKRPGLRPIHLEGRRDASAPRVLRVVLTKLKPLLPPASRELARAERDLRALLERTPEDRVGLVARAWSRFRQPALVRLLVEESRRRAPGDPVEAYRLAELALRIANRYPGMPGYAELYVLAVAHMANARRVGGDRRRASELFTLARRALIDLGATDPAVVARVDDLLSSLRKDQRRLPEAARLLRRAVMQFGLINARPDAARVLINLGAVYHDQKDSARAIETTRSALALLGPEAEPRLHLCGLYNLAFFLAQDVQREAMAALVLFQEAAEKDLLTVETVREVAAILQEARRMAVGRAEGAS
jgi:tetratricopeptide (TPR) repeat protein